MTTATTGFPIPKLFQGIANTAINQDPAAQEVQNIARAIAEKIGEYTGYLKIAAVAFVALGLVALVFSTGLGIALIVVSLPIGFFAYNMQMMQPNLDEIIENPAAYILIDPTSAEVKLNSDQIKAKLKENTFCFDYPIDTLFETFSSATPAA